MVADMPSLEELATDYVSLDDICAMTRLSRSGFRNLRNQGRGPAGGIRMGRTLYWRRADIEDWLSVYVRPIEADSAAL